MNSTADPPRRERRSRWTDLWLTVCGLFVLTVFLMLMTAFNGNAGLLARFFDRHGLAILGVEVGAILIVSIIVLRVERRESQRRFNEQQAALLAEAERSASDDAGAGSLPDEPVDPR
jgi:hypothetical protein